MNGKDKIVVYKDDKFWNPDLKADFMKSITKLWGPDYISQTREQKKLAKQKREEWAMGFSNFDQQQMEQNIRGRLQ